MASVIRPPFWMPRQDDGPYWSGSPQRSPIIPFLTQQKFFGAGGQVPAKNWSPLYVQDDPPPWYPLVKNLNSSGILDPLTYPKFYGQGGQAPPFRPNFTYDDPPVTDGFVPHGSMPLVAYTGGAIAFYGQRGQAYPFRWNWGLEHETFWLGESTANNGNVLKQATQQKPYRFPIYAEDSYWQGAPVSATPVIYQLTVPKQFRAPGQTLQPFFPPAYTIDDSSGWAWTPQTSDIIYNLTQQTFYGQGGQGVQWRHDITYDDPPPWQPWIDNVNSHALNILTSTTYYSAGGQVPPFRWNFGYDDPPFWQITAAPANPNLFPASAKFPPGSTVGFTAQRWAWGPYSYDIDPPGWSGSPVRSAPIQNLTSQTIYGQGGQVVPFRWNFSQDEAVAPWPASPQYSPLVALVFVLEVPPTNITGLAQTPFYVPRPDDLMHWQPYSKGAGILQYLTNLKIYSAGGQVPPFRPNWAYEDSSSWLFSPTGLNIELNPPPGGGFTQGFGPFGYRQQQPFINWHGIEHETYWLGAPTASRIIPMLSGSAFTLAQFDTCEHETFWQGSPVSANIPVTQTPIIYPPHSTTGFTTQLARWVPFNYDIDAPGWPGRPQSAATLAQLQFPRMYGVGGQTVAREWSRDYTQDDSSSWIPVQYPPLILTQTKVLFPPGSNVGFIQGVNRPVFVMYDVADSALWLGQPIASMYGLTKPAAPPKKGAWLVDFWRRGRRRA